MKKKQQRRRAHHVQPLRAFTEQEEAFFRAGEEQTFEVETADVEEERPGLLRRLFLRAA